MLYEGSREIVTVLNSHLWIIDQKIHNCNKAVIRLMQA
jgi:hypothetical protein